MAVKPDKMEETLTCVICQDLLHDCVRCALRPAGGGGGLWVASGWSPQTRPLSFYLNVCQAESMAR